MKKKKLFVIDGHALCYRAYFAFIKNPLLNSSGQNISALFGFARMFLKLVETQRPDYLLVAFDSREKGFRFDLYPEYKANRQKMPDDLRSQIDEIVNLVRTLGLVTVIADGYEADDVLGSAARRYAADAEVWLVTGDKDAYQLVNDDVRIYANTKGIAEFTVYDREAVIAKLGLSPEQVIDYMALLGDTSDNVPGVKGIGEKTAQKLIQEYGSLENIFANADAIKGKTGELIRNGREQALLSKELVTIRTDLDVTPPLETLSFTGFDAASAAEYFTAMEMKSIAAEFAATSAAAAPDFQPTAAEPAPDKEYRAVLTRKDLDAMVAAIAGAGLVSVDTETTSVKPVDAEMVGMSFAIAPHTGWYVPVAGASLFNSDGPEFTRDEAIAAVRPVLEDPTIRKVGQNIKYDMIVFRMHGIALRGVVFDTMIASYVLDNDTRRHNMDDMAQHFLNYKTITYDELTGTGRNRMDIREVPLDRITEYAAEDADVTLQLYHILDGKLADRRRALFADVEMPLVPVLADMERTGVKIDRAYFSGFAREIDTMVKGVEARIHELAGGAFNINSTRELAAVLFERLGLKGGKKTKTGYSTDISVLESLSGTHPVIDELISYRSLAKLKNTYVDTLPELISPATGRIHTSYNQAIVATGRLSSSEPNLQNIPARDDFGKKIRKGFVADEGFVLLSADYSQIELRLAAHLSGDENMRRAFREGLDIHTMTGANVFGVAMDAVEPHMRRQAKIINFATIYGVSPFGLSQQADITPGEAKVFIEKYFETYPGFRNYMDRMIAFAREHGYVETLLGRRRSVPEINSSVSFRREGAERVAINTPIQGTSADMIKCAMVRIHRIFAERGLRSRMILQVHDELVVETALDELEEVRTIVTENMIDAVPLDVPVTVDTGVGADWAAAH